MMAVPARHPLLTYKRTPLVPGDPHACEGYSRQVERVLRQVDREPLIAERVASLDLMMAMVAAGFALDLAGTSQIAASRDKGWWAGLWLVTRLFSQLSAAPGQRPFEALARFIERVRTAVPSN